MLDKLFALSQDFLTVNAQKYRRYFIQQTELSEWFAILLGQRGVGNTTLLVQYLLDYAKGNKGSDKILYVQSDHFALGNTALYEIANQFYLMGGEFIAFDEIHKYESWSMELKSICDTFGKLKIIASGSSALEIHKGSHDLSRRALVYHVVGLSFREYLEMALNITLPALTLSDMIKDHTKHTHEIVELLASKNQKILPFFNQYLLYGFYPYWFELNDPKKFKTTLEQNLGCVPPFTQHFTRLLINLL